MRPFGSRGRLLGSHVRTQYLVHASLVARTRRSEKGEDVCVDPQGDLPFVDHGNQWTDAFPGNAMRGGYVREVDILVSQPS
jgi:hypothetical protein